MGSHTRDCTILLRVPRVSWKSAKSHAYFLKHKERILKRCRAYYKANKGRAIKYARKARQKHCLAARQYLNFLKSQPCMDCAGSFNPWQMDFDHRDRRYKLFNLSSSISGKSTKQIITEANKCDVVCSNCHRNRTHKQEKFHHGEET
jgi:hypothetical protein